MSYYIGVIIGAELCAVNNATTSDFDNYSVVVTFFCGGDGG